jgi:hypothetical protein
MNTKHGTFVRQGPAASQQAVDSAIEQLIEWAVNVLDRECRDDRPGQDTYQPQRLTRKDAA